MSLNSLTGILLLAATLYGALVLYLFIMQPRLLYLPDLPNRRVEVTPAAIGLDHEQLTLIARDGVKLDAWFIPARPAQGTLLLCHGNAGNISHRMDSIDLFNKLGYSVLIFDYRGFGRSEGKPAENGTYLDAQAAWDYLTGERHTQAEDIVLFGRSLGAAVAAGLASRTRPGALIIESAFTSVPDMAAELYPWLPVRWLSRYRYDVLKSLASVTSPVLVIHSREDEIIPYSHGRRVYAAAREPKQFLEIHGGHNDGFLVSREIYIRGLKSFLEAKGTDPFRHVRREKP